MKFTDGNWMMRRGRRLLTRRRRTKSRRDATTLTIHAPAQPIRHRGDTLTGPLLTVRLSSPLPDVIRVRLTRITRVPRTVGRTSRSSRATELP